ncbi:LysR substrate-binding domain-containing protein [Brevundimonas diminuta]
MADSIDCVLRSGPLNDSSLLARHIGEFPLINVVSPTYLERYGAPKSPSDLSTHHAVNYASPTSGRIEDWEWTEDGKVRSLPMCGRVTVNSAEAYVTCCLVGLGLIQVPAYDVRRHLDAGELVEVMAEHQAQPMLVTLLYSHRKHFSLSLHVFAQWLERLLQLL